MADQKVRKKGSGMKEGLSPKTILFVTTGHLTTNPRLIKEAEAATAAGYKVIIIGSFYVKSQVDFDKELLKSNPTWMGDFVDWTGNSISSKVLKVFSGIRQKLARLIVPFFPIEHLLFLSFFRIGPELLARAIKYKHADFVIAHNLGALPVAGKWSKVTGKSFGFDAEDYHPGETKNAEQNPIRLVIESIEDYWIPRTGFLTAASPFIAERYQERFPEKKIQTVNNVFSLRFLAPKPVSWTNENPLTICWFSQTVGPERGLEYLLPACGKNKNLKIKLLIIGNLPPTEKSWWNNLILESGFPSENIKMAGTLSQDDLFKICTNAHIGIALEDPEIENRDICLTNKIFTYLLCGMAIIGSTTKAQTRFFSGWPGIGELVPFNSVSEIARSIQKFYNDPDLLQSTRMTSWTFAKNALNWENESQIWISNLPVSNHKKWLANE